MGEAYVVAIKPSARRASAAAGEWVLEQGRHRTFDSRALAREWARSIGSVDRTVWVQDAHPRDASAADGYLLARRRDGTAAGANRTSDQTSLTDG